ncbi:putative bifunctional diguanylate cyclase/phosphodiesterase [Telluria aromaticivorans]|uniref:EAL domain-containing protein n=1 Tax=Telluria aromaticivorans TaxID=2725995 RepID=A0A7Y2JVT7_9BURK|nr:GGDEF domain-containing phosphodiesterase [Telluria aromaticivorans]NNG21608.1 EAL domain-containing protein [Telluria aromaticivorans]
MEDQASTGRDAESRAGTRDAVDGLPDLKRHRDTLAQSWADARSAGSALSLLHLQLGRLQEIGQVFGDEIADELFGQAIVRLEASLPRDSILARFSDDTLSLILRGSAADDAAEYAEALCHLMDRPFAVAGMSFCIQVSGGLAGDTDDVVSPAALCRRANAALAQTKPGGRRVALYTNAQQRTQASRLALMGDLFGAVERDELRLYCQPKIDLRTGRIAGAETLVRWAHPRLGLIPAAQFIALAEQSGMIGRVTSWVLNATLGFLRGWQAYDDVQTLAVNLSAHDIRHPAMAQRVQNQLDAWGVRPELLQFELTESALIEDPDAALATLRRLKDCGVEIMIDDYGTGYASLSYLRQFPMDGIKIDQSFIAPILGDVEAAAIVRSTIALGHALGRKVVAEGVECRNVSNCLAQQGCDLAQGYLFSMPMPIEELPRWQAAHIKGLAV